MERIFEIAKGINNPYSLLALTYLVSFVLFRGVLSKVGVQAGKSGYKVVMRFMSLIAVIAILTLLAVFGLKAYEVYAGTKVVNGKVEIVVDDAVKKIKATDLQGEFSVDPWGANFLIGNQGQGIILVSDLSFHWKYRKFPIYEEPLPGAPLVTYRYDVNLTTRGGSQILDSRIFKYGPGEVDQFKIDLHFPDYGIYAVWVSFNYRELNKAEAASYETATVER